MSRYGQNEERTPRRSFIVGGLASLLAAPAVVRAASLMQVRALPVA